MARTPRIKHLKHRQLDRVRYSTILLAWLTAQSTRLATSVGNIFVMLVQGFSTQQVEAVTGKFPVNTVAPAITGTKTQGQTLTASNGTWTGTPTPTYTRQWRRNGAPIAAATAATYVLTVTDVGATITVSVTATNTLGSVTVTSSGAGPIIAL